jgi:hypothetical protein
MIVTVHHMPLVWDVTMTDPHHEDWLRLQGHTPGKHHLLRWDSAGTQLRGEDCPALWGQTARTPAGARITCGGTGAAKIELDAFALDSKQVETYPLEEVNVKLFELLPFLDLPGQRSLTTAPPVDLMVKQALARLERRPSRLWLAAIRDMEPRSLSEIRFLKLTFLLSAVL